MVSIYNEQLNSISFLYSVVFEFEGAISEKINTISAFFFLSGCCGVGTVIVLFLTIVRLCQFIFRKFNKNSTKEKGFDPETKKEFITK